jgi:ribose-phosphate pyrophosphokinase
VIGEVEGKNIVMFDDVVTTARTLTQAAEVLKRNGAGEIYAGVTHGVFCPDAFERVAKSPIKELAVTDTLDHSYMQLPGNVVELSVAGLLGEAVQRIHEERSLSSLFV